MKHRANRLSYRYFNKFEPDAMRDKPWDEDHYPREYRPTEYWLIAHPPLALMWWLLF